MAKNSSYDKSSLTKEELIFFENRKLKDKFFIGKFKETKSGYQISDIRRSDFSKIKYKPKGAKVFVIETEGFFDVITEDEAYYRFTWVMVKSKPEYVFDIDEDDDRKLMLECASWLGVKYRYGGNNKNGVDCSGLTCNIYRNVYSHSLHRSSFDQYSKDVKKIKRKKLKSGDLVFFATGSSDRVSHVGIYLKDNLFIHASSSRGVVVSDLDQKYYKERWVSGGEVDK